MQRLQSMLAKGPRPQHWVVLAKACLHPSATPLSFRCVPVLCVGRSSMRGMPTPLGIRGFTAFSGPLFSTLRTPIRGLHTHKTTATGAAPDDHTGVANRFLRSAAATTAGMFRFSPLSMSYRGMSVRGKDGANNKDANVEGQQDEPHQQQEREEKNSEAKSGKPEGDDGGGNEDSKASGAKGGTKKKGPQQQKKNSFGDHIRGLKEDYAKFPDIYNSANLINFIVFTVFCLCSTGSNAEEKWWLDQWGLDNTFHPWNWVLHSFLTNNFLSMTYAMMLLHTLCHAMLPTLGSQALMAYVVATATTSGAIIWLGNRLYYGSGNAPEKQFGPWDIVHALFVMYYLQFAITPVTVLNSFNSWMKYAVWVGEVCILYFDWQPTFVGTLVGLALCKSVPRFRVKPVA